MLQRWPQDSQDPGYSWFLYLFIIKIDLIGTDGFWNVCQYVSPETPQLIRFIFILYIYTSVGIQYAFEGSSSWHILCWQDCWTSTLRHFKYHWKSSLMGLFLMKYWFTRSISNDLWPTSLFWENILLPDYGHHWVAIFVWMPFWSKSKTRLYRKISKLSCHYSWWTNSVKPVDW